MMPDQMAWRTAAMGTINVLAAVLAARMIVLVAVIGGIVLTWNALGDPNTFRVAALSVYGMMVVIPAVALAFRQH
jgi:hypothetical protein